MRPGFFVQRGNLIFDFGKLFVKILVFGFAHALQDIVGFVRTHGGEKIQTFGQPALMIDCADIAPYHLPKNILVKCEALTHQTEAFGGLFFVFVYPNPHRVDFRRRQVFGTVHEFCKQTFVSKGLQIGCQAENSSRLVRHIP